MLKKYFPLVSVILSILVIVWLGFRPEWHEALFGDGKYYYSLAQYFFDHHKLVGYPHPIAYPPGANTFFLLLSAAFFFNRSFPPYETLLIGANIIFLLLLLKIYLEFTHSNRSLSLFSLLILTAGPIILFRFDLLVVLFTALALKFFQADKHYLAVISLSLAMMTKIFPVVLLPLFLLLSWIKDHSVSKLVKLGLLFFVVSVAYLGLYMVIFTDPPSSILAMLNYNFTKGVHIESPLGTFLTIATLTKFHYLPPIDFINGLFVLSPMYYLGHLRLFRFTNSLGLVAIYALVIFRFRRWQHSLVILCLTIILSLIISSQVISPQYLVWPFFLIPMVEKEIFISRFWRVNFLLILVIFALTQYIYPLNYNQFIFDFYKSGRLYQTFYIMTLRNVVLVILAVRLISHLLVFQPPRSGRKRKRTP